MVITTDYTSKGSQDTLRTASLTRYRLAQWMSDILKNFFSDPVNIKDERLCGLLGISNDMDVPGICDSLVRVEMPYSSDARRACVTPAVLVSTGATKYTMVPINGGVGAVSGSVMAQALFKRTVGRAIDLNIAVLTESCDGTSMLADIIEDFLVINSVNFQGDGMVQQLAVRGGTDTRRIPSTDGGNAKDLYQITLSAVASGALTWTEDTQGPTFRGVKWSTHVK